MTSEAQKRAVAAYEKKSVKTLTIKFFPADWDIYEYTKSQPKVMQYVRDLIRADMEKAQQEEG